MLGSQPEPQEVLGASGRWAASRQRSPRGLASCAARGADSAIIRLLQLARRDKGRD